MAAGVTDRLWEIEDFSRLAIHLMTPSWAGNELAETTFGKATALVNHLRVTLLPAGE